MSLILEALRKSEAERRRGHAPDVLADMPQAHPTARVHHLPWHWLLPLLAVALMAWWLATRSSAPPAMAIPPDNDAAAAPGSPSSEALPPVPRLTPPPQPATHTNPEVSVAPVVDTPLTGAQAPPVKTEPARTPEPPQAAIPLPPTVSTAIPSPVTPPVATPALAPPVPAPPATVNDSTIETLSDLSVDERKALPPLKLSMHLWNADPAQRFVILDGNRVVEGDRVGDMVVTAITSDGVVLDWRGRRLKLPIR